MHEQEQDNESPMTREDMDAMVAEAMLTWPDAELDESVTGDLEKATKLIKLADKFHTEANPLYERLSIEAEKAPDDRRLTNFEGMFMLAVPDVYENMTPKSHIQSALVATILVSMAAARAKLEAEDDEDERVTTQRAMQYMKEDFHEIVPVILNIPKEQQLRVGTHVLRAANEGRRKLDAALNTKESAA